MKPNQSLTKSQSNERADIEKTWGQIVDQIVDNLEAQDLPEQVIQATELLLNGFSLHETAEKLDVSKAVIRSYLTRYPVITRLLADYQPTLIRWRMAQMEKQFLIAVERSAELLSVPLDGVMDNGVKINPKVLGAVAQHVRFVMQTFIGQRQDIHVHHDAGNVTLQATKEAMDYLADRLANQQEASPIEPVTTTYRVIDAEPGGWSGPLVQANGEPHHGELGCLELKPDEGYLCHICGSRVHYLNEHVGRHGLTAEAYEFTFLLPPGSVTAARPDYGEPTNEG